MRCELRVLRAARAVRMAGDRYSQPVSTRSKIKQMLILYRLPIQEISEIQRSQVRAGGRGVGNSRDFDRKMGFQLVVETPIPFL